jgi:hypothetical protein
MARTGGFKYEVPLEVSAAFQLDARNEAFRSRLHFDFRYLVLRQLVMRHDIAGGAGNRQVQEFRSRLPWR